MKVYNVKGLIIGLICAVLGVAGFVLNMIRPDKLPLKEIKDLLLYCIIIVIGITEFVRAFSKKAEREDRIEEMDERNQLIALKSKAKVSDLFLWVLFISWLASVAGYILTKSEIWIGILITLGLLLSFYFISILLTNIYYEKHQ